MSAGNNLMRFVDSLTSAGLIRPAEGRRVPLGWAAHDSMEDKYEARVIRHPGACWDWIGQINSVSGYAYIGKTIAHRWSYEHHIGPIPDGLTIDHLCRVTSCTNPDHLEAVTQAENNRRAKDTPTCRNGHLWTEATTYRVPSTGRRNCRTCNNLKAVRLRARRSAARRAAA